MWVLILILIREMIGWGEQIGVTQEGCDVSNQRRRDELTQRTMDAGGANGGG